MSHFELTPDLLASFLDEAQTYLTTLEEGLLSFESSADNGTVRLATDDDRERMNEVFRAAHSLKGISASLGLDQIRNLTHVMESLFDQLRMGVRELHAREITALFGAVDNLRALVDQISGESDEEVDSNTTTEILERILVDVGDSDTTAGEEVEPPQQSNVEVDAGGFDADLMDLFMDTTVEALDDLTSGLLKLEDDPSNVEQMNQAFRCAHNIKGSSGAVKATEINRLTHGMETLLDRVRTGKISISSEIISTLLEGADLLRRGLNRLDNPGGTPESAAEVDRLLVAWASAGEHQAAECKNSANRSSSDGGDSQPNNTDDGLVEVVVRFPPKFSDAPIIACVIQNRLAELASTVGTSPDLDTLDCSAPFPQVIYYLPPGTPRAAIEKSVGAYESEIAGFEVIESAGTPPQSTPAVTSSAAPPPARQAMPTDLPQAGSGKQATTPPPKAPTPVAPPAAAAESGKSAKTPEPSKSAAAKTLRVDLNRLDNLMNLSGELVITKARFTDITRQLTGAISQNNVLYAVQDLEDRIAALHAGLKNSETPGSGLSTFADEVAHLQADFEKIKTIVQKFHSARPAMGALAEAVHGLDRVAGSMQKGIMETRMVAVGPLFQRFRRVVRDIAAQTNKKVDLELRGESTELDKRMIDELVDPLTHMIRNCVDHGIETPADRVKVGKPESGRVILNAFHRGRHICVEVRDDGKGLNIERIRAKIIERDLASARQVEQMTDKEAMQFIFKPGFSTAPQVTDLSGRGMGMDIVQTRIDELNGYVELNSTPGVGTVFTIQIPLTLAILNTMVVRIGCEVYAIPLENVREIITVPRDQLRTVQNQPVMEVRNRVIPLARLESLIHLSDPSQHTQSITNSAMTVLVLGLQGERMGLIADELIGQDDAVIKDIAANYRNVNGVTGASIRGDGRVSLILDVATLMSSFATRASQNTSFEALQPVMAKAAS